MGSIASISILRRCASVWNMEVIPCVVGLVMVPAGPLCLVDVFAVQSHAQPQIHTHIHRGHKPKVHLGKSCSWFPCQGSSGESTSHGVSLPTLLAKHCWALCGQLCSYAATPTVSYLLALARNLTGLCGSCVTVK